MTTESKSTLGTDEWREVVGAEIDKAISQVTGFDTTTVGFVTNNIMANVAIFQTAPWYALLLKAVLKEWTIYEWEGGVGHTRGDFLLQLHRPIIQYWLKPDANGLPACPDAETYERIRKAVEGE